MTSSGKISTTTNPARTNVTLIVSKKFIFSDDSSVWIGSTCLNYETNFKKLLLRTVPVVGWLRHYKWKNDIVADIVAGFTVAIMHIPQGKNKRDTTKFGKWVLQGWLMGCWVMCHLLWGSTWRSSQFLYTSFWELRDIIPWVRPFRLKSFFSVVAQYLLDFFQFLLLLKWNDHIIRQDESLNFYYVVQQLQYPDAYFYKIKPR
jgi:hypothetical protein